MTARRASSNVNGRDDAVAAASYAASQATPRDAPRA